MLLFKLLLSADNALDSNWSFGVRVRVASQTPTNTCTQTGKHWGSIRIEKRNWASFSYLSSVHIPTL